MDLQTPIPATDAPGSPTFGADRRGHRNTRDGRRYAPCAAQHRRLAVDDVAVQRGHGRHLPPSQFADSDYEQGRGPQGKRKKSWLSKLFD